MRRAKGEGSWEKTASGKIRHVRRIGGKKLTGPPGRTRPEALSLWLSKYTLPHDREHVSDAAKQTLSQLVSKLFAEDSLSPSHPISKRLEAKWAPSTLDAWRRHLASIGASSIGSRRLESLTSDVLQRWVNSMTPRTARNYYADLRILARECGVKLPPVRFHMVQPRDHAVVLPHEFSELLENITDPMIRLAVALLYYGGFRLSEVIGLRSDSYNAKTHEFTITRSAVQVPGKIVVRASTKTGRVRRVPILAGWLQSTIKAAPPGYIVHDEDQTRPYSPVKLREQIRMALRGTKFAGITPQGFRRSAATAYALGGVDIHVAAAILGHSSKMLLEVYAQYRPESRAAAASAAFKDAL